MESYRNAIGQYISPGDKVVYFSARWFKIEGEFLGTTKHGQVKISANSKKKALRNKSTGKTYNWGNSTPWVRKPYEYMVHKETGYLADRDAWYRMTYSERQNFRYETEGKLKSGYEIIEVPYNYYGVMGLSHTFRVEDEPPF